MNNLKAIENKRMFLEYWSLYLPCIFHLYSPNWLSFAYSFDLRLYLVVQNWKLSCWSSANATWYKEVIGYLDWPIYCMEWVLNKNCNEHSILFVRFHWLEKQQLNNYQTGMLNRSHWILRGMTQRKQVTLINCHQNSIVLYLKLKNERNHVKQPMIISFFSMYIQL